jgi:hypothetical protein
VIARASLILLTLSVIALQAFSQTESTGAISGIVRDQSGAVVPQAAIRITQKNTDAVREIASDRTGRYIASLLPPGEYSIRVELKGFHVSALDPVVVRVTEHSTADFVLRAAGTDETVLVTENILVVNTSTATKGEVIGEQRFARHRKQTSLQ